MKVEPNWARQIEHDLGDAKSYGERLEAALLVDSGVPLQSIELQHEGSRTYVVIEGDRVFEVHPLLVGG